MTKVYKQTDFDMLKSKVEQFNVWIKEYLELAGYEKWARVVETSDYVHTVNDEDTMFIVFLKTKTCTCMRFQMEEILCSHIWVVLKNEHLVPDPFCSEYYKPKMLLTTYNILIYPLSDRNYWKILDHIENDIVRPSEFKRQPKRPQKKLCDEVYNELYGKKSKNSCSTCGNKCHNRRSSRNGPRVT
ncbi:uncharacterized protein LOC129890504 [Solanum dulcamara]|uniref:uncharacterized protein LOC129890504 n=1 Tax=Solanum dulcamara TaxID=45834 RepID=UPI002485D722|nr:uncharacterized protein LOC129890504 [Solanum dulcamara]